MGSITEGTLRQYLKPLKDWSHFCTTSGCKMLEPESQHVLTFLVHKFNEGVSAGSLNTYRSALSFILGERISRDPWVTKFMRGIYKLRPARPRYDRIYELDPVLQFIERLYPLAGLSLREITLRLSLLLAIVTAHRKQTLSLIKLENISETSRGYEIRIPERIKTSRPGTCQPLLLLPRFVDMPKLCVASTLDHYLQLTKHHRGAVTSLFITTTKPFRAASKDTISNWLRQGLREAGINEEFAPHSIRHASTSAAFRKGVKVALIKDLAGWSEKSQVFDRFYNRPLVSSRHDFARAVLSRDTG